LALSQLKFQGDKNEKTNFKSDYNTALGTLLDDLKDKSIDDAVAAFEAKMYNYKRTTKVA